MYMAFSKLNHENLHLLASDNDADCHNYYMCKDTQCLYHTEHLCHD